MPPPMGIKPAYAGNTYPRLVRGHVYTRIKPAYAGNTLRKWRNLNTQSNVINDNPYVRRISQSP